jgi:hypothetical protein
VQFSNWCKGKLARIIKLILSGTLSVSISTAVVSSEETKSLDKSGSAFASKAEAMTSTSAASKTAGSMSNAETEASSDPVPDLVTSIRALEVQVLGVAPDSESIEDRLIAMEGKLFGKKFSGSLFERLIHIRQVLTVNGAADAEDTAEAKNNAAAEETVEAKKTAETKERAEAKNNAAAKETVEAKNTAETKETVEAKNTAEARDTAAAKDAADAKDTAATVAKEAAAGKDASAAKDTDAAAAKKTTRTVARPSRAEQLLEAHKLFDDKNYRAARKAMEVFIARNPLIYNGYYLLGLIDLKEHEPLPEFNQFAYNQFLKANILAPKSPDCDFVCRYVMQAVRSQRPPDPRSVAVSAKNIPIQALLNIGVNCFLRSDDADARDLFEFIVKYFPGGAASANYNLAAMAEKHGQLQPALALYRTALTASYDRDALVSYKLLQKNDVDILSAKLIRRTIQRIELKIKTNDRSWTGNEQEKGTPVIVRCTINRLSSTDIWADIVDAGDNLMQ